MKNTPKKGKYRWIIFKKGAEWYGVAMEFNIVQVGDDPQLVYLELQEAVRGYIEAAQKIKGFRDKAVNPMLNQTADEEYESLWEQARATIQEPVSALPVNVYNWGISSLAAV